MESTTWFRCSAWNGIGQAIAQYKHKGDPILIAGKVRFDKDPKNEKIIYHKVTVINADFIATGGGNRNQAATTTRPVGSNNSSPQPTPEEDIPF